MELIDQTAKYFRVGTHEPPVQKVLYALEEFRPLIICETRNLPAGREVSGNLLRHNYFLLDLERGAPAPECLEVCPEICYFPASPAPSGGGDEASL